MFTPRRATTGEQAGHYNWYFYLASCAALRGLKRARSADVKCPECGLELLAEELEDHTRAHQEGIPSCSPQEGPPQGNRQGYIITLWGLFNTFILL